MSNNSESQGWNRGRVEGGKRSVSAASRLAVFFLFLACLTGTLPVALFAQHPPPNVTPVAPQAVAVVNFTELANRESLRPAPALEPQAAPRPLPGPVDRAVPPEAPRTRLVRSAAPAPSASTTGAPTNAPVFSGFLALDDNNTWIPPDTHGAVGPINLMTTLNSQVRIQDRMGNPLSTVSLGGFWAPTGTTNVFDPRVMYDPQANRFIASAVSDFDSPNSSILLGVSQTGDPTGNWTLYRFAADPSGMNWADFDVLGYDPNWVLVTTNNFTNITDRFVGASGLLVTKSDLYAGGSLTVRTFSTPTAFTLTPATSYDPSSTTLFLVEDFNGSFMGSGFIRLSTITGPVGSETYTEGTGFVSVSNPWGDFVPGDLAPQMGSIRRIDVGDARMGNCVLRFSTVWCAHTVLLPDVAPTRSAAQWWQFDPNTFAVLQFGRVDDSSGVNFYAYPTIAVNMNQDVLIGYSGFSANRFAGADFSFRAGTDPPSTLQPDTISKDGEAPYFKTFGGPSNRYGDYSATVVDPDGLTFWTIQEYAAMPSGGFDRWGTWWSNLRN